ncbi:hypothetical protein GIB67_032802 [Kingdonia uniflora]|uniref:DUF506 family protein n=1 Tax=Kingdonia uniflora TaxID=39325 RepID=A0A7J7MW99_9MAGN|nr:hypothetical protein GIB67_032802 [Kingdonia uniflora]
MAKIPFRYARVTAAFDEMARARLCESSGSEYSADSLTDLSDLVNSFIERDDERSDGDEDKRECERESERKRSGSGLAGFTFCSGPETKEMLHDLLQCDGYDQVKESIRVEVELAVRVLGTGESDGFKRRVMNHLRERGLDAGLCKSKWKKIGPFPVGDYEYIDVLVDETRYVVEVSLVSEFSIARPSSNYQALLDIFPEVCVFKVEELKQVVKLMCPAAKESMRNSDMLVPPWRKKDYMMSKWCSSYKRTTRGVLDTKVSDSGVGVAGKREIGFDLSFIPVGFNYCGGELERKVGLRVGNMAHALNGMNCN